MTSVLDRVPAHRIADQAARWEAGPAFLALSRALLAFLAGLLYAAGWVCAKAVQGVWRLVTWTAAAVTIGWKDGLNGGASR